MDNSQNSEIPQASAVGLTDSQNIPSSQTIPNASSIENSQNSPAQNTGISSPGIIVGPQEVQIPQSVLEPQTQPQILQQSQPIPDLYNTDHCKYCNAAIPRDVFFCPNCGKKLKDPPPSTTAWKQISLYTFAIIAPPFGILPGIKYIMHGDDKAKVVGYVTIALTLIAFIITTIWTFQFFNAVNQQMSKQIGSMGGGF